MHPVYHAKITVSTKNFPRSEGRKCGVKGLDQWHGLMVARMSSSSAGGESATYFTEPNPHAGVGRGDFGRQPPGAGVAPLPSLGAADRRQAGPHLAMGFHRAHRE